MGQTVAIDTLGYVKALKDAGIPAAQAEAPRDKIVPELMTKLDLKDATSIFREEISALGTEVWRMGLAIVLGTTTLVTAVQKLLH